MSEIVQFHSRVGPDGTLDLKVPLGQAGADVLVTIQALNADQAGNLVDWHAFVNQTYGSCADLGLQRQSQGTPEQREAVE